MAESPATTEILPVADQPESGVGGETLGRTISAGMGAGVPPSVIINDTGGASQFTRQLDSPAGQIAATILHASTPTVPIR